MNGKYSDDVSRFNPGGPTSVQRRREVSDCANVESVLMPDSVGAEFGRKGWNKLEIPTSNDGTAVRDKGFPMPGGNAGSGGSHNSAAYPGGTVA